MAHIDEIAPTYIGEDRIRLTLDPSTANPRAHQHVLVNVDYSMTLPEGLMLPLEVTVAGPSATSFTRRIERRRAPASVTFLPREGGTYLVRVAELGHNRWWGRIQVTVAGDTSIRRGEQ